MNPIIQAARDFNTAIHQQPPKKIPDFLTLPHNNVISLANQTWSGNQLPSEHATYFTLDEAQLPRQVRQELSPGMTARITKIEKGTTSPDQIASMRFRTPIQNRVNLLADAEHSSFTMDKNGKVLHHHFDSNATNHTIREQQIITEYSQLGLDLYYDVSPYRVSQSDYWDVRGLKAIRDDNGKTIAVEVIFFGAASLLSNFTNLGTLMEGQDISQIHLTKLMSLILAPRSISLAKSDPNSADSPLSHDDAWLAQTIQALDAGNITRSLSIGSAPMETLQTTPVVLAEGSEAISLLRAGLFSHSEQKGIKPLGQRLAVSVTLPLTAKGSVYVPHGVNALWTLNDLPIASRKANIRKLLY